MKNFIVGLILGISLTGISVHAIDVSLNEITVRDLFASSVLNGLMSSGPFPNKETAARLSFEYADQMLLRRKR